MKIEIPFNNWSKDKLSRGLKSSTARTKRYGHKGDWFEVEGKAYFLVSEPYQATLAKILENHIASEGASCREELEQVFMQIFKTERLGYSRLLWLHFFIPTGGRTP